MPLRLNLDPKPLLRFAHPSGLTVFTDEASEVDIILSPGVVGRVQVSLHCLADEVAFKVDQAVRSQADFEFDCANADEHQLLQLQFVLVCSDPSDQDILIRFEASAHNQAGQQSPPIPQLPVTLKPRRRQGRPLAPSVAAESVSLPSEQPTDASATPPAPAASDEPGHDPHQS